MENLILHTEYLSIYQVLGVLYVCPNPPASEAGRAGKEEEPSVGYTMVRRTWYSISICWPANRTVAGIGSQYHVGPWTLRRICGCPEKWHWDGSVVTVMYRMAEPLSPMTMSYLVTLMCSKNQIHIYYRVVDLGTFVR